ncbi:MAG: CCA tRNA nucleotidyltransferase [Clostridia bacterium]|nr:CCA tRNA nucleotidyltransferase [Clostridia bacterium]
MPNFTLPIPAPVAFVLHRLEDAGYHAYCVGGCVRDSIMGQIPKDYDITTSAKPEEMQAVFSDCRVVETGLKHGTLTVVKDGMNIEVTTYRIDGTYDDGRHPDSVTFTDKLSDDLCRRDFTINAMAYSPHRGLVDLYGGCEDIEKRTVRCVGRANERFSEDGLRILRALRFSSVLEFTPDEECARAVHELKHLLCKISRERIYVELTKLIGGGGASRILSLYPDVVAYSLGIPDSAIIRGSEIISADEALYGNPVAEMRYAALLSELDVTAAESVFASLKPSREEARAVGRYLKYRGTRDFSEYAVLKMMGKTTDSFPASLARYEHICGRLTKESADATASLCDRIICENKPRRVSDLKINGEDLMKIGLTGRAIGQALDRLLEAVINGDVANEKEMLVRYATEL